MKATRTVTWETKDGRAIEVTITKERTVRDNISYADGWNINVGKETVDQLHITVTCDGKGLTSVFHAPAVVTEDSYGPADYAKIKAAGGYARLGDTFLSEDSYNKIMAAIAEADAEAAGDAEYEQVKAVEEAEEAREDARLEAQEKELERRIANGFCPKCGTYCYGDCTAH